MDLENSMIIDQFIDHNYALQRIRLDCGGLALKSGHSIMYKPTENRYRYGVKNWSTIRVTAETIRSELCSGLWLTGLKIPSITAVAHTCSMHAMVVGDKYQGKAEVRLGNYRDLQFMKNIQSSSELPIIENKNLEEQLTNLRSKSQVLVRGHGLFVWGAVIEDVISKTEALENLMAYMHISNKFL